MSILCTEPREWIWGRGQSRRGNHGRGWDYLEFGVFFGSSMVAAMEAFRGQRLKSYVYQSGIGSCRFLGFDSFDGLKPDPSIDTAPHSFWNHGELISNYETVEKRLKPFRKHFQIDLVKGYYNHSLDSDRFRFLNLNKVRVCLVDCDLKSSTLDALEATAQFWQRGTVLLIDDYFSYCAQPDLGEHGAFSEFFQAHPELKWRDFGYYGFNGVIKVITSPLCNAAHSNESIRMPMK